MDSMIKEINDKLKAIIDSIRNDRDSAIETLNNIQTQMDNKVDEAKGYKNQVDESKERIKSLEEENSSLEDSLDELNEKYSKMNLVSVIEAGNREIRNKINDNIKIINKEKEHIADLTNKARTIKDLLISLKKDKTLKEEKLDNINIIYDYYTDRVNNVIDYAFDHANTLNEYKDDTIDLSFDSSDEEVEEIKNIDIDNTTVFEQIANIDDLDVRDNLAYLDDSTSEEQNVNDDFDKDEFNDIIKSGLDQIDFSQDNAVEESSEETEVSDDEKNDDYDSDNDNIDLDTSDTIEENNDLETDDSIHNETESIFEQTEDTDSLDKVDDNNLEVFKDLNTNLLENQSESTTNDYSDDDGEDRINRINDLFSSINVDNVTPDLNVESTLNHDNNDVKDNNGIENQIDSAYMDIFGKPLEESELNDNYSTLTDIFGNPIKQDEVSNEVKVGKQIEELFNENGIDFNRFREDEQNYLKQIYDEEKYVSIINVLNNNKINLENIYHAFNIFGEISSDELNSIITKLLSVGQSAEAIGFILEKLPKVKKYDLDLAINSFGNYISDVNITELIMKAKELYDGGNN